MNGTGVDLIIQRMTDHDMSNVGNGLSAGPIVLAELDVSRYREGTLEVLVKSATIPSGGSFVIGAYALARSDDDAGKMYLPANLATVASVTISATVSSATLVLGALSANFGAMIAIAYSVTQGGSGGTLKASFETRISLKN